MRKILVNDTEIQVIKFEEEDYISSIKEKLIPRQVTKQQTAIVYAPEADVLNVALFGKTAKELRVLQVS